MLDVALQLNSSQWNINGNDTDYFLVSPIKSSLTYSSVLFSFLWLYTEYHSLLYVVEDGGALGWKEQVSWITPPRKPIHCSGTLILDHKVFLEQWKFSHLFAIVAGIPKQMQN